MCWSLDIFEEYMYGALRYRLETLCINFSWKIADTIFLVFPELYPLVKLRPFDKQIYNFL